MTSVNTSSSPSLWASAFWPGVPGRSSRPARNGPFARNETGEQNGTPTHEWLTEVRYRYTVKGVNYVGKRLRAFGLNHFDQASALKEIEPFQAGSTVKVYYDPAKPESSVLIPG
jgi:hypothetical protein